MSFCSCDQIAFRAGAVGVQIVGEARPARWRLAGDHCPNADFLVKSK
jgi:hypothetical protein